MSDLFWLSRAQMRRIEPYFPLSHGVARVDDRRVISGIRRSYFQHSAHALKDHLLTVGLGRMISSRRGWEFEEKSADKELSNPRRSPA